MNSSLNVLPMAQPVPPSAGAFKLPSPDQDFVLDAVTTAIGKVPRVGSQLSWKDKCGHYRVRWNIGRDNFMIEPGLYALGTPDHNSHVLVTANYKLTFDLLRGTMAGRSCWILVLDTKGINVWCAAGKGTFGTEELVDRIQASRLQDVVTHRRLIVPQLGATGVAAFTVKKYSGFSVKYGPVMLDDLVSYLEGDCTASPKMREKKFSFGERLVLVPVEIMLALKQGVPIIVVLLLLAGFFGEGTFLQAMRIHGFPPVFALLAGIVAGTIVTPLLLPWIPCRAFSCKGALGGLLLFGLLYTCSNVFDADSSAYQGIAYLLICLSISSWLGMAFTGSSTYTSLNGVRKEMLRAMPVQFVSIVTGIGLWVTSLWIG